VCTWLILCSAYCAGRRNARKGVFDLPLFNDGERTSVRVGLVIVGICFQAQANDSEHVPENRENGG
jgi:hypothetical protein